MRFGEEKHASADRGTPTKCQRLRLSSPEERDALGAYLRNGGWEVERVGKRDLRARYRFSRDEAGERVNLHFSLALWRALNAGDEPVFELG
jgi:hypothetical protein